MEVPVVAKITAQVSSPHVSLYYNVPQILVLIMTALCYVISMLAQSSKLKGQRMSSTQPTKSLQNLI